MAVFGLEKVSWVIAVILESGRSSILTLVLNRFTDIAQALKCTLPRFRAQIFKVALEFSRSTLGTENANAPEIQPQKEYNKFIV
eukprot:gene18382-biopygen5379